MAFTLNVDLKGLLHYIENEHGAAKKVRLCVVLPEAAKHDAKIVAQSGSRLSRQGQPVVGPVSFDGKRVAFRLTREPGAGDLPEFDFERQVIEGAIKGIVPMERIIGPRADRNAQVCENPSPRIVRAQILVEEGWTFSVSADIAGYLVLPNTLTGRPEPEILSMSESVIMKIENLQSAEIMVFPLTGSTTPEAIYTLEPGPGEKAAISISYLCPDQDPTPEVDEDFAFHYQLLGTGATDQLPVPGIRRRPWERFLSVVPSTVIRKKLKSLVTSYSSGGANCAGGRGLMRPYDLDAFSQVAELEPSSLGSEVRSSRL